MKSVFATLAFAAFILNAAAVIPENDHFATRIPLVGTNPSATGNNVDATKELDEPDPAFLGGKSVWWTWTAPSAGYVTISTAGSSFDTMLTVCTGTVVSNLTVVAFNDTETNTSIVNFNAAAGTAYQISVDGAYNATGMISLQLSMAAPQAPPANDDFADRIVLVGSHFSNIPGSTLGASAEPGEPLHADSLGFKSVWWSWTAPASGGVTLTTQGSAIDTMAAVYTGNSVGNLTLVAGNDEDPLAFGFESRVTFNAISNVTYQIAVDGYEGESGFVRLRLDLDDAFPIATNNHFANRRVIAGSNISTNGSNVGATYEPGEPMHLVTFGGKTVWYSWTAPSSGGVSLTVSNDVLDTLVAVYRGTSLNNLVFVAGNDEDFLTEIPGDSTAYFNATNGTTYQIAVDGYDGTWGNFNLRLVLGSADAAPANDHFANRTLISGTDVTRTTSSIGASFEVGEPLHRGYYGGKSVWWRWVSPNAGFVTVDTIGSLTDTLLAVYTGTVLSNLVEVATDDESGGNFTSLLTFPCKSNVTYQIAVDGYDGDGYDLTMRVRFVAASYTLTVGTNPAAAGSVSINPAPDQAGRYAPGSVVTLTATPTPPNLFSGWSGAITSTNNSVTVMMNSNKSIVAGFLVVPTTKVWTGASNPSGNWSASQNWSGGVPVAGDILIFPEGALRLASNTNDFPANTVFKSILFGGSDYFLRGNAINLTEGIVTTNASGTNTLNLPVQLNANQSFRVGAPASHLVAAGNVALGNRTLTVETVGGVVLSGIVSGNGDLIKTNSGTLWLIGNNTNSYSGTTLVKEGTLRLGKTGAAFAGPLNIGDGVGGSGADIVQFISIGQFAVSTAVTISNSGSLDLSGFNGTVASLTMNGGSVMTGAGTLGLKGNLTANAATTTASISGKLSLEGATRTLKASNGGSAVDLLISAVVNDGPGAAGIIKTGDGNLQLNAANTYSGLTTINEGRLEALNPSALGATDQGTIVNGSTTLRLGAGGAEVLTLGGGTLEGGNGTNSWLGSIILQNDSVITVPSDSVLDLSGVLSGPGEVTKSGGGTLRLSGGSANTYSGTTSVNQGTLLLAKLFSNAIPGTLVIGNGGGGTDVVRLEASDQISSSSQVTINDSGLLDLEEYVNAVSSIAGQGQIILDNAAARLSIGHGNASMTFAGLISGPGGISKTGSGTVTFTGNNAYTGSTLVDEGTLLIQGLQPGSSVTLTAPAVLGGNGRVGKISGSGTVSPGISPGIFTSSNLTLSSNMTYRVELNGPVVGLDYDRLNVLGGVNLAGELDLTLDFVPSPGASFIIIDNDGSDSIVGTFQALPQDSLILMQNTFLQISYLGGAGSNDVVLAVMEPPAPTISLVSLSGPAQFQGQGTAGLSYVLEAIESLEPPLLWTALATNIADANGLIQFEDAAAPNFPMRLYRIRWQF